LDALRISAWNATNPGAENANLTKPGDKLAIIGGDRRRQHWAIAAAQGEATQPKSRQRHTEPDFQSENYHATIGALVED
jgi:hypothetical protein